MSERTLDRAHVREHDVEANMGDMPEVMTVMQGGVECTELTWSCLNTLSGVLVGRKAWVSLMHYAWLDVHRAPQRD